MTSVPAKPATTRPDFWDEDAENDVLVYEYIKTISCDRDDALVADSLGYVNFEVPSQEKWNCMVATTLEASDVYA